MSYKFKTEDDAAGTGLPLILTNWALGPIVLIRRIPNKGWEILFEA